MADADAEEEEDKAEAEGTWVFRQTEMMRKSESFDEMYFFFPGVEWCHHRV